MSTDEGIRRKFEDLNRQFGGTRNLKGERVNIERWVNEIVAGQRDNQTDKDVPCVRTMTGKERGR